MLDTPGDEQISGRIIARRLSTNRIEFGWLPSDNDKPILPRARYFPRPSPELEERGWLRSSPVEIEGSAIGRIEARLSDGRIEFAFTPTDGDRILPPSRYFPRDAEPERWLRSTEITIGPPSIEQEQTAAEPEQPTTPTDPNAFIAVSAGYAHTCALRASGAIECWGSNFWADDRVDQSTPPAGSFTAIAAGSYHNCAIRESDSAIECWGRNHTYKRATAGQTDAPPGEFRAVAAGNYHSCGLRTSGTIVCWGGSDYGEGETNAPTGRYSAISAGSSHTCALRESGAIECWGDDDITGHTNAPAGSYSAISAGQWHTCALRESGAIECWGANHDGTIEGIDYGQTNAPAGRYIAISAGGWHTCAIRESDGAIECWGLNNKGQAAHPAGSYSTISAGYYHTCAIRESDSAIECWGRNEDGQADAPPK